jgi:hypothetical protein
MTALNKIGQRDIVTGSPERGLAAGFSRHDSGVQWCEKKMAPDDLGHQGPDAPLAHRRPEYPSSGCVPAEPDSVSPGTCSLPYWHDSRQKAPQSGVQKIPQPKIRREALDARGSFREGTDPCGGRRETGVPTATKCETGICETGRYLVRRHVMRQPRHHQPC